MNKLRIEDFIVTRGGKFLGSASVPNEDIVNIESTGAHYAKLKAGDSVRFSDGKCVKVVGVSLFSPGVLDTGRRGISIEFEGNGCHTTGEITWE